MIISITSSLIVGFDSLRRLKIKLSFSHQPVRYRIFAQRTTCRLRQRLYFINNSIKAIQIRQKKNVSLKVKASRFVRKTQWPAKFRPPQCTCQQIGQCWRRLTLPPIQTALHRNALVSARQDAAILFPAEKFSKGLKKFGDRFRNRFDALCELGRFAAMNGTGLGRNLISGQNDFVRGT